MEEELERGVHIRNNYAKIFFLGNPKTFSDLYRKVSGSKRYTPENWHRYVNSPELYRLIYDKLITLSREGRTIIAYCELDDDGFEIWVTGGEVIFAGIACAHENSTFGKMLMTMRMKQMSESKFVQEEVTLNQIAARSFLKTVNHMVFAWMFKKKPFTIRRRNGHYRLNERLDYVKALL